MNTEAKLTLKIAKEVAFNNKDKEILSLIQEKNIDWDLFKNILSDHGLASFAYSSLKEHTSLIPEYLRKVLEATYYHALRYTSFLEHKFLALFNAFENQGVLLIPIKGMALLEDLYSELPIRQSVDIDVLVQRENIDISCALLEQLGFEKHLEGLKESYWREKQYHLVFISAKESESFSLIVELHWALDYPRKRELLPKIFSRLRELPMQNRKVKVLSPEDTFFSLVLHQRHFGRMIALRDVCDIARLLNKYGQILDWEYVLTESKKSKICASVFFILYQAKFWLGLEIPEYVFKELNIVFWKRMLIKSFIKESTFLSDQNLQCKSLYLRAHFLLYDGFWEPIEYILNIPQEQFAKFYGLDAYSKKTDLFYRNRIFYILYRTIFRLAKKKDWR